jgi:transcriptional regulator with XRE-family HTH domain
MAKWRALEDYSPFARLLVEYMWGQRPPLLPNQFAHRMGVRKQQVSSWLNSDATPSPSVLVRLARGMALSVSELFIAAGYTPGNDPLFDTEEAWTHIIAEVRSAPEFLALAEPQQILVVGVLEAAHLRDRANHAAAVAPAISEQRSRSDDEASGPDDEDTDEGTESVSHEDEAS